MASNDTRRPLADKQTASSFNIHLGLRERPRDRIMVTAGRCRASFDGRTQIPCFCNGGDFAFPLQITDAVSISKTLCTNCTHPASQHDDRPNRSDHANPANPEQSAQRQSDFFLSHHDWDFTNICNYNRWTITTI